MVTNEYSEFGRHIYRELFPIFLVSAGITTYGLITGNNDVSLGGAFPMTLFGVPVSIAIGSDIKTYIQERREAKTKKTLDTNL